MPSSYSIVDLGALTPDHSTLAYGINKHGHAVGQDYDPKTRATAAVLWKDGKRIDVGDFGFPHTIALAVNDSDVVVGQGHLPTGEDDAFVADKSGIHDLGTLGGTVSSARAINADGIIAGASQLPAFGPVHAFLYDETGMHDLGGLGGVITLAHGINRSRVVVGESDTRGIGMTHAFLRDGSTLHDLGTLGGTESWAYAINDSGQVAGTAYVTGDSYAHAFLYDAEGMHDLGALPGYLYSAAYAINGRGDVVGAGSYSGSHAMLYQYGVMVDLNDLIPPDSGWVLERATGINDCGQIPGFGAIDRHVHAFLLNPDDPSCNGVHDSLPRFTNMSLVVSQTSMSPYSFVVTQPLGQLTQVGNGPPSSTHPLAGTAPPVATSEREGQTGLLSCYRRQRNVSSTLPLGAAPRSWAATVQIECAEASNGERSAGATSEALAG